MPIDRESKTNLIQRIVKESKTQENADNSDEVRIEARRRKEFYNLLLNRLNNQSSDSNQ